MQHSSLFSYLFIIATLLLFAFGCESGSDDIGSSDGDGDSDDDDNDDDNDGESEDDDSDDDDSDDDDSDDDDDNNDTDTDVCEDVDFPIDPKPVQLMILQDQSSSMNQGTPTSKWDQARAALTTLLTDFAGQGINFGFDVFPNQTSCIVSDPCIRDCWPDNEQLIIDNGLVANDNLPQSTPLYLGMQNFLDDSYAPNFLDTAFTNYLLVVSDGQDSCGSNAQQLGQVTAQLLSSQGVMTIVIGFGTDTSAEQLNAIAAAGGTQFTTYLQCDDQAALEAAFDQIATALVSCTYEIGELEEDVDMSEVNVYFDGEIVYWDDGCADGVGWTWTDASQTVIQFCDEACAELQSGEVDTISATFGCPSEPVPQ